MVESYALLNVTTIGSLQNSMRTFYAFHLEECIKIFDKCWNYDLLRIIDGSTFSVIICVSLIEIVTVRHMRDF